MPTVSLTKASIARLPAPDAGRQLLYPRPPMPATRSEGTAQDVLEAYNRLVREARALGIEVAERTSTFDSVAVGRARIDGIAQTIAMRRGL